MAQRQLPVDFKEFLSFLNSNKVKYLLLGGWAVGIYGHPRAIKDIDLIKNKMASGRAQDIADAEKLSQ
jgi:hypothetical protein